MAEETNGVTLTNGELRRHNLRADIDSILDALDTDRLESVKTAARIEQSFQIVQNGQSALTAMLKELGATITGGV